MEKFSPLYFFLCLHTERIHRRVYDGAYRQDARIGWRARLLITYYNVLFRALPGFRTYLRHYKPILIKAYNIKRATIRQQMCFWHVRHVNVERYS